VSFKHPAASRNETANGLYLLSMFNDALPPEA
jgi:hypothetical protein